MEKRIWKYLTPLVFLGLAIAVGVLVQGSRPGSVPIVVSNASFELPRLLVGAARHSSAKLCGAGCAWNEGGPVTDWAISGTKTGLFHPDGTRFRFPLPDGDQTGYSDDGTLSQTLSATLQDRTHYSLSVKVGRRQDATDGYGNFPGYVISLYAGNTFLAADASRSPAAGTFATATVSYNSKPNDPLGQPLRIVLTSRGRQTNFDDVQLSMRELF